jgi:heat-inducible transcriptional repressor
LSLSDLRSAILERLRHERTLYDALMARALRLTQAGLDVTETSETLHVQGTSFLFEDLVSAVTDREDTLETLRALFRMIEEKHRLVTLLTGYLEAPGVTVVIGSEHGTPDLQAFSLVASTFHDGTRMGTVGVIGPTRMRYQRAIAVVDSISQTVTRALEGQ